MSAYSVIGPKEAFDIIISNPPYALDFEAEGNTPAIDRGDLGFSIVRGFKDHLADGGISMLFYRTAFYHHVMIEFARQARIRGQEPQSRHSRAVGARHYLQLLPETLSGDSGTGP